MREIGQPSLLAILKSKTKKPIMSHIMTLILRRCSIRKRRNEYCPSNERSCFSEINTHHHKVEIEGDTNQKHTGNEDLKRRFFVGERASSPSNSPSIPPCESNRNNGIFYQPHQPSYARERRICKSRIMHLLYSVNLIESTETPIYKPLSALVMYIYTAMSPRLKQTLRNRCWTACPFYDKLKTQSI